MFLMRSCPTINDSVALQPVGQLKNSIPKFNQTRNIIRKFSDTSRLIELVQKGQIIMQYKIKFDQYIKSQVDLMKGFVGSATNCQFKYNGFLTQNPIQTTLLTIKQQWGFEIIMSRFILSSVYTAGALQNIGKLFEQTSQSYNNGYQNTPQFTKNLQITFKYFFEGIDPLRRLSTVIDSVAQLFSPATIKQFPQAHPQVFKFYTQLLLSNLAYLKLQKYRILNEYKSCKQGAWAVYQKMKELKLKLARFKQQYSDWNISEEISNFINLCIVFYKGYAFNALLCQNEHRKIQEEYGFIKKQFQYMIYQNLVVADELLKLQSIALKLPGQQQDNVIFANSIMQIFAKHAQSIKYKFEISIHENTIQKPSIDQIASRIEIKNIWDGLQQF